MAFGPERTTVNRSHARTTTDIDVGLRAYMIRVYNYMSLGVALTGAIAFFISTTPVLLQAVAPYSLFLFLGIIGMAFAAPYVIRNKSAAAGHAVYWLYASLWGVVMAPMFYVYMNDDPMLLVRAFLITAATFGALSLYGYTTKRDLSPLRTFFFMAFVGLLIAMLVNIFLMQSTFFSMIVSAVAVLLFAGVTAYDTQKIKQMYVESDNSETQTKKAIYGALTLYIDFIGLFIHILRLLSMSRG